MVVGLRERESVCVCVCVCSRRGWHSEQRRRASASASEGKRNAAVEATSARPSRSSELEPPRLTVHFCGCVPVVVLGARHGTAAQVNKVQPRWRLRWGGGAVGRVRAILGAKSHRNEQLQQKEGPRLASRRAEWKLQPPAHLQPHSLLSTSHAQKKPRSQVRRRRIHFVMTNAHTTTTTPFLLLTLPTSLAPTSKATQGRTGVVSATQ